MVGMDYEVGLNGERNESKARLYKNYCAVTIAYTRNLALLFGGTLFPYRN